MGYRWPDTSHRPSWPEETLGSPEERKEVELCYTVREGDGLALGEQIGWEKGHNCGCIPDLQKGEVFEECVHRSVQSLVLAHHYNNDNIPCDCEEVDEQENGKEQRPPLKSILES